MAKIKAMLAGLFVVGGMLLTATTAFAQKDSNKVENAGNPEEIAAIRQVLTSTQPNIEIGVIKPSPIDGMYEVNVADGQVIYASADARHFIPGDLYEARGNGLVNLGKQKRNEARAERIAALDESSMVVFEANGERKAALTVFTDVDCPYCRQLHQEVPALNDMGIAVRYLAFPRTGLDTPTHEKMVSTWCAEDPRRMLTQAKNGDSIPTAECDNPVAEQYQLGREVGVSGTPALVLADGTLLPGYVPADTLAAYLLDSQ